MQYWLFKSEPETFRIDEQRPAADWLRDDKGVVDGYLLSRPDGMPMMSSQQALPQRKTPARSSCDESLFHVYWFWSKRIRLPRMNTVKQI